MRSRRSPSFSFLAWGPPHDPYFTAPEKYRALYDPEKLTLRPNVPEAGRANARKTLAGYYAHCTALDDCLGELRRTLQETGLAENTLLVFTADHGDMLGSQGAYKKQRPYDESIRIPLLMHWPKGLGVKARQLDAPINSEDLMPTVAWAVRRADSQDASRAWTIAATCAAGRTRGTARP